MNINENHSILKNGFANNENVIKLEGENLKHLQKVLLMMLKDFDKIAKTNNIKYSLSGGSVLGALRHGGFIPWDDDIDINVTRKDYEKIRKVFKNYKGDKYTLCTPEDTHDHGISLPQIKLKNTVFQSYNELAKEKDSCGICIDIFVMENTFDNKVLRYLHGIVNLAFGYMLTCRKTYEDIENIKQYVDKGKAFKAFQKKARIGRLLKWIKLDTITKLTVKCYKLCRNDSSKFISIPTGRAHYFKEMCTRDELCDLKTTMFDGIKTYIPERADDYMRRLYGDDYMTPPPESNREQHPLMSLDFGIY